MAEELPLSPPHLPQAHSSANPHTAHQVLLSFGIGSGGLVQR